MLSVLVLYRFHDEEVKRYVDDVIIQIAKKTCNVITIEQASDDPRDDLYWLKIYYALRLSADIVVSVKKDGEKRSESITFEQDYIARTMLKGHPFMKRVAFDLTSTLLSASYASPLDVDFRITNKMFRSPKPFGRVGSWCRFRSDVSSSTEEVEPVFENFFKEISERRAEHLQDFQRTVPSMYEYWRYAKYRMEQSSKFQSVITKHSLHSFTQIPPKKPDIVFDFDDDFRAFLESPKSKSLFVIAAKMKDIIGRSQSQPWKPWSPKAAREYVSDCVPQSDLKGFSWYLSGLSTFTAFVFLLTWPLRPLLWFVRKI